MEAPEAFRDPADHHVLIIFYICCLCICYIVIYYFLYLLLTSFMPFISMSAIFTFFFVFILSISALPWRIVINLELKTDPLAEFLDLLLEHMRMSPVGSASSQHENNPVRFRIALQALRKEDLRDATESRCVVADADMDHPVQSLDIKRDDEVVVIHEAGFSLVGPGLTAAYTVSRRLLFCSPAPGSDTWTGVCCWTAPFSFSVSSPSSMLSRFRETDGHIASAFPA